jgi:hypothetical protein
LRRKPCPLRACLAEIAKVRGDRSLWRWFRDSRQSELVVILGEDIAAEIGLVLALAAVLAAIVTGNPMYDALGSVAIGVVLVVVALGLAVEIHGLLIGQSAEPATEAAIRRFIEERQEVARVLRVITLQLGGNVMVAVKAHMRDANAGAKMEGRDHPRRRRRCAKAFLARTMGAQGGGWAGFSGGGVGYAGRGRGSECVGGGFDGETSERRLDCCLYTSDVRPKPTGRSP